MTRVVPLVARLRNWATNNGTSTQKKTINFTFSIKNFVKKTSENEINLGKEKVVRFGLGRKELILSQESFHKIHSQLEQ